MSDEQYAELKKMQEERSALMDKTYEVKGLSPKASKKTASSDYIWIRLGDPGDYEKFGDIEEAANLFKELNVSGPFRWQEYGFSNSEFEGQNYVSIFHGDEEAQPTRELDDDEKRYLEKTLGGTVASKVVKAFGEEPASAGEPKDANPTTVDDPTHLSQLYDVSPTDNTTVEIEVKTASGTFKTSMPNVHKDEGTEASFVKEYYPDWQSWRLLGGNDWIERTAAKEVWELVGIDAEEGAEYVEDMDININEDEMTAYFAGKPIAEADPKADSLYDDLATKIHDWMIKEQYWPSIWIINERGNMLLQRLQKKAAVDNFEVEVNPTDTEHLEIGGQTSFANNLLTSMETIEKMASAPGGEGDDGSAYDLIEGGGRNTTGIDETEASLITKEFLNGKACSIATLEDYLGFMRDNYGVPKNATIAFKQAWFNDDAKGLMDAVKASLNIAPKIEKVAGLQIEQNTPKTHAEVKKTLADLEDEYLNADEGSPQYSLKEFQNMETISQGQADDLKIETPDTRVWLSRMTVEDGALFDNGVTIEKLQDGSWVVVDEYEAV
jgi:hypothetical protein